jgi:hypothetical protein
VRGLIEREPVRVRKSYRGVRGYGWSTGAWLAGMKVRTMAKDPRFAVTMVTLVALLLLSSFAVFGSDSTTAATGPKNVRGYVWDSGGTDIPGANVTIRMLNGVTPVKVLYYDATEPDGLYTVTFGPSDWNTGYTIEVTAVFDGITEINSTVASDSNIQFVNATLEYTIPEFGGGLGTVFTVASFMAVVIVIASRRRGRI